MSNFSNIARKYFDGAADDTVTDYVDIQLNKDDEGQITRINRYKMSDLKNMDIHSVCNFNIASNASNNQDWITGNDSFMQFINDNKNYTSFAEAGKKLKEIAKDLGVDLEKLFIKLDEMMQRSDDLSMNIDGINLTREDVYSKFLLWLVHIGYILNLKAFLLSTNPLLVDFCARLLEIFIRNIDWDKASASPALFSRIARKYFSDEQVQPVEKNEAVGSLLEEAKKLCVTGSGKESNGEWVRRVIGNNPYKLFPDLKSVDKAKRKEQFLNNLKDLLEKNGFGKVFQWLTSNDAEILVTQPVAIAIEKKEEPKPEKEEVKKLVGTIENTSNDHSQHLRIIKIVENPDYVDPNEQYRKDTEALIESLNLKLSELNNRMQNKETSTINRNYFMGYDQALADMEQKGVTVNNPGAYKGGDKIPYYDKIIEAEKEIKLEVPGYDKLVDHLYNISEMDAVAIKLVNGLAKEKYARPLNEAIKGFSDSILAKQSADPSAATFVRFLTSKVAKYGGIFGSGADVKAFKEIVRSNWKDHKNVIIPILRKTIAEILLNDKYEEEKDSLENLVQVCIGNLSK